MYAKIPSIHRALRDRTCIKENESLNAGIKEYEIRMKKIARESYP